jgi:hypothetical protein
MQCSQRAKQNSCHQRSRAYGSSDVIDACSIFLIKKLCCIYADAAQVVENGKTCEKVMKAKVY